MDCLQKYNQWKTDSFFDPETRAELSSLSLINDIKEIEERFYCELQFGTGGMRGIMGAGTNRINRYTIGKASFGFGHYLQQAYSVQDCNNKGVAIAYDTRHNSAMFAKTAADVLTALGIKVYLFKTAVPTPTLSFAVQHYGTLGGIVVTASHNPKAYNGYKVYDETGCQLVPKQAKALMAQVNQITEYTSIPFTGNAALLQEIDCTDAFVASVLTQSVVQDAKAKENLRVVYTPLHGTGLVPVCRALAADGFTDVLTVPEQAQPDGAFSTVKSPNPEDANALALAHALAEAADADVVLGTDPDADRVGVGVKNAAGAYELLTGNQIGALLIDFLLSHMDLAEIRKPAIVSTLVTSSLGTQIAKKHGLSVFCTLTGFKFIGEKITQFEQAAAAGDESRDYTFVFGYEESYGYLVGTHARDKDAVVASLLICEMAAEYKAKGYTLLDRLSQLYEEYGYYCDAQDSFTLHGKDGIAKMDAMMQGLRQDGAPFADVEETLDCAAALPAEAGFGTLPKSNVLKYQLADGSWAAVRPSGTEPKIKIYYSATAQDEQQAQRRLVALRQTIQTSLGLAE